MLWAKVKKEYCYTCKPYHQITHRSLEVYFSHLCRNMYKKGTLKGRGMLRSKGKRLKGIRNGVHLSTAVE